MCGLLPLTYRRIYLDLSFYMSILLEENCLDFSTYFEFLPATRTRDALTLRNNNSQCKHKYYEEYFFNRIILIWNTIPFATHDDLVNIENKPQTKPVIKEYLFQALHETFESDNKCTWFVPCTCTNCTITWL